MNELEQLKAELERVKKQAAVMRAELERLRDVVSPIDHGLIDEVLSDADAVN